MYVIVTDKNGRPIDDATPFPVKLIDANGNAIATDEDGNLLVQLTGSNVDEAGRLSTTAFASSRYEIETLVNAQSVAASAVVTASGDHKNADLCLIAINIDQQPWTLWGYRHPFATGTPFQTNRYYPTAIDLAMAYASLPQPYVAIPVWFGGGGLFAAPASKAEAIQQRLVGADVFARVENKSASIATVTIRIMRFWGLDL